MIDGRTGLMALLGHPVSHSLSPAIHNGAFRLLGLNYAYLAFDITPEELPNAVSALRTFSLRGVNLTMPLKESVIPLLDELSEEAGIAGSVNTIVNEDGRLVGHTTDGAGYIMSLREAGFEIRGKNMVLLGGGGAAKSILLRAAMEGALSIQVFKRKNATFSSLADFAKKVSSHTGCDIRVNDYADMETLGSALSDAALLTNATNVGMGGDSASPLPADMLHSELFVSDIIYNPLITTLLRDAENAGCKWLGGKDMLLYQAACSFRLWTGCDMPVSDIKKLLEEDKR